MRSEGAETADAPASARSRLGDLPARIAYAIPVAALAVALVATGGLPFAIAVAGLAAAAAFEAFRLLRVPPATATAGCLGAAALVLVAHAGGRTALAPAIAAALAAIVLSVLTLRLGPEARARAAAGAALGLLWIGFAAAHAVLIRKLDHGGGLLLDVLLAVFIGDTAAHLYGSARGRRPLAPGISPNKTVEGLLAGLAAGICAPVVVAAAFQPWLGLAEAALIGAAAAAAAALGDLFESLVKRGAGVKDSGSVMGPHGGVLDRLDAVLFAVVAGYYVVLALL